MKIKLLLIILLVGASLFFRLYRISDLTEFLGDQGSAGIIIYDHLTSKTLPLVGPEVSTGQRPGPFYYYFVAAPFIFSGFNAIVPPIWMSFVGVVSVLLVLYLGTKLFGFWIGYAITSLYGVSSAIVSQSRNLWNPTPIPFLIILALIGVYKVYEERNYWYSALTGFAVGAMIQLHYTTFFVLGVTFLAFLYSLMRLTGKNAWQKRAVGFLLYIAAFLFVLSPFLIYEYTRDFVDIREVILLFFYPEAKSLVTTDVAGLAQDLFANVIPLRNIGIYWLIPIVVTISSLLTRRFWALFFSVWFWLGVGMFKFYHGSVFGHYLYFLIPIPFLLFGGFLKFISRFVSKFLLVGLVIVFVVIHLQRTDIFTPGHRDIPKTGAVVGEMIKQSGGKPFAFTLIGSRSFSDLHYRYFFHVRNITVESVEGKNYKKLFVICESNCPNASEIVEEDHVVALCFDFVCNREYPWIALRYWKLIRSLDIEGVRLFTWERKI